MPWYEYSCPKCGHQFEMKQGFDSPTEMRCPNCEVKVQRKMSLVNNTFGWTFSENYLSIKDWPHELVRNI